MEPTAQQPAQHRSIDLAGLSDEQQRAVEALVTHFRSQPAGGPTAFASYQEWAKAFREWVESHPKKDTLVDDSRDSIYAGRGE
jgi:hypothetical protein